MQSALHFLGLAIPVCERQDRRRDAMTQGGVAGRIQSADNVSTARRLSDINAAAVVADLLDRDLKSDLELRLVLSPMPAAERHSRRGRGFRHRQAMRKALREHLD